MLLYIAMADAYGMATEYVSRDADPDTFKRALSFKGYVAHPKPSHAHKAGLYSDDTEMSIANAMVITAKHSPSALDFACAYVNEFHYGGQRKGYSRGFQSVLEDCETGHDLLRLLDKNGGGRSNKNGAAMRSVPFGVIKDLDLLLSIAEEQAKITHDSPEGIFSSLAVALMSHHALYESEALSHAPGYAKRVLSNRMGNRFREFYDVFDRRYPNTPVQRTGHTSVGIMTVHAVIDLIANQHSLMDMLKQAIIWGGDTDSVAAIAWGIASARFQDEKLPAFLTTDLEQGSSRTGAERLRHVGRLLMGWSACNP
ncbi:MAG: ADP-ribosylglycohydrolase family protein [Patescibacteria group bacterium]